MGLTIMKPRTEAPPPPRNGVDTPKLFATIGHVAAQPELAKFQFRTESRWIDGTHSRSAMTTFLGAGGEHSHKSEYAAEADHPAVLCGADQGPTPVEHLLHALSSCLIAGIANVAAARGVTLKRVEAIVEGDIDLRGILGLAEDVRNGYQGIRMSFRISGDASPDKLREIVEQSRARSAVAEDGVVPEDCWPTGQICLIHSGKAASWSARFCRALNRPNRRSNCRPDLNWW